MVRRTLGLVLVLTLAAGCASSVPSQAGDRGETSVRVDGLATDGDDQGLVVSYLGGACDGSARLSVRESADRIDIAVLVTPRSSGPTACAAVAVGRTVRARLEQPVADRAIVDGDRLLTPFDGSRTLVPAVLPSGFTERQVSLGGEPAAAPGSTTTGPTADTAAETTRWTVTFTEPTAPTSDFSCVSGRGAVQVDVAPSGTADVGDQWSETATVVVHGRRARLLERARDDGSRDLVYVWQAPQGTVSVGSYGTCAGDQPVGSAELLEVAGSLASP